MKVNFATPADKHNQANEAIHEGYLFLKCPNFRVIGFTMLNVHVWQHSGFHLPPSMRGMQNRTEKA